LSYASAKYLYTQIMQAGQVFSLKNGSYSYKSLRPRCQHFFVLACDFFPGEIRRGRTCEPWRSSHER